MQLQQLSGYPNGYDGYALAERQTNEFRGQQQAHFEEQQRQMEQRRLEQSRRTYEQQRKGLAAREVIRSTIKFAFWPTTGSSKVIFPSWNKIRQEAVLANQQEVRDSWLRKGRKLQVLVEHRAFRNNDKSLEDARTPDQHAGHEEKFQFNGLRSALRNKDVRNLGKEAIDVFADSLISAGSSVTSLSMCPNLIQTPNAMASMLAVGLASDYDTVDVLGTIPDTLPDNMVPIWMLHPECASVLACYIRIRAAGSVISLEWAPAANVTEARMGILAVAVASGNIYLFSVPRVFELNDVYEGERLTVFRHRFDNNVQGTCLCWSSSRLGTNLYAGLSDGTIAYWDVASVEKGIVPPSGHGRLKPSISDLTPVGDGQHALAGHKAIRGVCCNSDDSTQVAAISNDGFLRVWDVRVPEKAILEKVCGIGTRPTAVAWPSAADYILVGDDLGRLSFHRLVETKEQYTRMHGAAITCIVSNPGVSPTLYATASRDGICRTWVSPVRISFDAKNSNSLTGSTAFPNVLMQGVASAFRVANPVQMLDETNKQQMPPPDIALGITNERRVIPSKEAIHVKEIELAPDELGQFPHEIGITAAAWGTCGIPVESYNSQVGIHREWLVTGTASGLIRCQTAPVPIECDPIPARDVDPDEIRYPVMTSDDGKI